MWLCVDRVEGNAVILIDDEAAVLSLPREVYVTLTSKEPRESDVLRAELENGQPVSAVVDDAETERRHRAARDRLGRLFGDS